MRDQTATPQDVVTMQAVKDILSEYVGGASTTPDADPDAELKRSVQHAVAEGPSDSANPSQSRLPKLALPKMPSLSQLRSLPKPSRKQIILASLAAVIVLRPMWVILTLFALAFLILGTFVAFGADRVWQSLAGMLDRLDARNPKKAKRVRARLDRFAVKWDSVLDRMPDGLVDGLYLPDFSGRPRQDTADDAIIADRLSRMHEQV